MKMTSQTRGRLMQEDSPEVERLLTPAEVAAMFRVDPKTVTRWAKAGKLSSIRTLGGHADTVKPIFVHSSLWVAWLSQTSSARHSEAL
jgi:hypothetical protein